MQALWKHHGTKPMTQTFAHIVTFRLRQYFRYFSISVVCEPILYVQPIWKYFCIFIYISIHCEIYVHKSERNANWLSFSHFLLGYRHVSKKNQIPIISLPVWIALKLMLIRYFAFFLLAVIGFWIIIKYYFYKLHCIAFYWSWY